ncbi:hypothetical protein RFI_32499 [Reticulomyxa filosa]|uniref:Uncharacterized protein n=1 Tax=Reticulomyxa filosa TaxID=46433 RepID=X6LTF4_RETFI|nr:hypothetical protein RFI_32499 [Reticulomyxa filosa]|eukprot:ETO04899.1 hypothetical protein RFI_32499 [Reticulomyxa filosa]
MTSIKQKMKMKMKKKKKIKIKIKINKNKNKNEKEKEKENQKHSKQSTLKAHLRKGMKKIGLFEVNMRTAPVTTAVLDNNTSDIICVDGGHECTLAALQKVDASNNSLQVLIICQNRISCDAVFSVCYIVYDIAFLIQSNLFCTDIAIARVG